MVDKHQKSESLILALDIGTSSIRGGLFDRSAELLNGSVTKTDICFDVTPEGGFEIDADRVVDHVIETIDDLALNAVELLPYVENAAISSFWHSLVGVDGEAKPTTKLYGWAETRPASFVSKLRNALPENEIHNKTGCPFHSSYWPAKIQWIKNENSNAFERTVKWLSFPDYLGQRLFGDSATSYSMASGTGIFDIRKLIWDPQMLEVLGLEENCLPDLINDSSKFILSSEMAERWPELKNTKWSPAVGDGAANNAGINCLTTSKAALMIGTSGAVRIAYEGDPPDKIPSGLWCYRIDKQRVVVGGAVSDGGGLYQWLKETFRLPEDDSESDRLVIERGPASHGLSFLPFISGERGTGYHDFAKGAILGLSSGSDPVDILRAALESVAFRMAEIFDLLAKEFEIEEIVASGGALRDSKVWPRIICDVLGKDLLHSEIQEASLRGAVVISLLEDVDFKGPSKPKSTRLIADSENKLVYAKARREHDEKYRLLIT